MAGSDTDRWLRGDTLAEGPRRACGVPSLAAASSTLRDQSSGAPPQLEAQLAHCSRCVCPSRIFTAPYRRADLRVGVAFDQRQVEDRSIFGLDPAQLVEIGGYTSATPSTGRGCRAAIRCRLSRARYWLRAMLMIAARNRWPTSSNSSRGLNASARITASCTRSSASTSTGEPPMRAGEATRTRLRSRRLRSHLEPLTDGSHTSVYSDN